MHQTDIGDILRTTARFTTSTASTATKNPTSVKWRRVSPAGVVASYTFSAATGPVIVRDTTGVFHADVLATASGVYWYRWTSTGNITTSQEGSFQVGRRFVDT